MDFIQIELGSDSKPEVKSIMAKDRSKDEPTGIWIHFHSPGGEWERGTTHE